MRDCLDAPAREMSGVKAHAPQATNINFKPDAKTDVTFVNAVFESTKGRMKVVLFY